MKKTAVVTGAGAGIGQGIALQLAREGYQVYANARSLTRLLETLKLGEGLDIRPLIFDVTDLKAMAAAFSSIPHIDCLVNNAGRSIPKKSVDELEPEDWDSILDTNVKGYFFTMQNAVKKMEAGASIVNITSGAAKTGGDFVSIPYSSSKGAINSMTIAAARDLAPRKIRVNAVSPGFVDTAMLMLNGKEKEFYPPLIPLGRLGVPEDIANVVSFLLSDKADFMTGQIIEVNGGDIMG